MICKIAIAPLLLLTFYISIVFVAAAFRPDYHIDTPQILKLFMAGASWAVFCFLIILLDDK